MSRTSTGERRLARGLILGALALAGAGCDEGNATATSYSRDRLMDPETCKECHPGYYDEWSGSMHAYAAEDPVFRAMNLKGQDETEGALGAFCVNCHAPLAVREGLTEDGLDLDTVPKALRGVTCYFCHQVTEVTGTHDNPLLLADDRTMRGAYPDAVKNVAHHTEYSPLHDGRRVESSDLCGACHDIVVPAELTGAANDLALERTFTEWKSSVFAIDDASYNSQSCNRCHMRATDGPIADDPHISKQMPSRRRHPHTFPGVDVAITDFPRKDEQMAGIMELLNTTLGVALTFDGINSGSVTLENLRGGHNVPSGASQDRRMWVELEGYFDHEHRGSLGVVPDGGDPTRATDPVALFRDEVFDVNGAPTHAFWKAASVAENTIRTNVPGLHQQVTDPFGWAMPATLNRVVMTVRMQPIGRDVLQELLDTGYLDQSTVDAAVTYEIPGARLEWNKAGQATVKNTDL